MKKIGIYILLLALSVTTAVSQEREYKIRIVDKDGDWASANWLTIDDTVYITHKDIDDLEEDIYRVKLTEGEHRIQASLFSYNILDTTIVFSKENMEVCLLVDMKNNFHLYEFREGFEKIYTNKHLSPVIGVKADGTFLFKRFIHPGYAAWYQFETGTYTINNNQLVLYVTTSYKGSQGDASQVSYIYHFTLKDDEIVDIEKYGDQIGGIERTTPSILP